jgi:hypothetical protein
MSFGLTCAILDAKAGFPSLRSDQGRKTNLTFDRILADVP